MSIDYGQLRAKLRIEEVLSWMSWQALTRVGDQHRGSCPLCSTARSLAPESPPPQSGNRTFSVNTGRHVYRCFRCGSSGNALDLWSSYRQLPIYEAAQEVQTRLGEFKQP